MKGRNKYAEEKSEETHRTDLDQISTEKLQGDARQLLNAIRDANHVKESDNVTQTQGMGSDTAPIQNTLKGKANATGTSMILTGQKQNCA